MHASMCMNVFRSNEGGRAKACVGAVGKGNRPLEWADERYYKRYSERYNGGCTNERYSSGGYYV